MTALHGAWLVPGLDRPLSRLALGTAFYRLDDMDRCHALLDAFLAAGGTLIDTGRQYGQSEAVVGAWLARRGVRQQVVLMTKCAHGTGTIPAAGYDALVERELQESLEALQTDHVDLYLPHRDNHEMTVGEIMAPLQAAVQQGRVRALGASNWEYRRLTEAHLLAHSERRPCFTVVSNHFSLAQAAAAFYPGLVHVDPAGEEWHQRYRLPLIPWSSQARGFFAGDYTAALRAQVDHGQAAPTPFVRRMLQVYGSDANLARRQRASELGRRRGDYTATEVALAWLLHRPYAVIPVVGPRDLSELRSCLRATELALAPQEIRWLETGR